MTQFNLDLINKWPTFGWPLSSSTSIAALSVYAVGGFDPKLALDFIGNTYRTGGADSTLANSVTHARAGHATMVDSDGLLKWAPHNLLTYSQDFSSWPTSPNVTITSNTIIAPDGTTTADSAVFDGNANARVEQGITQTGSRVLAVWMKVPSGTQGVYIGFTSGDLSLVTVTDQWVLYSYESASGTYPRINCRDIATVHIWGAHAYRRDLGGMANNPDTSNSYVPTTTSAVYAPRVGHHVYNGSAWVNEGVHHESEARTNLVTNSNDLNASGWFKNNATVTLNAGVSPDGTSNANKFIPNIVSATHNAYMQKSLQNSASKHSFSVYVASAGYGFATVSNLGSTANDYYSVVIDLSNGTKTATYSSGTHTDKTCTVEDVGSFYRVTISGDGERYYLVGASDTGTYTPSLYGFKSFAGNGTSGILIYGAQVEAGSTPSSYIPTSGSTVTRAAETLTVPAANLPYSSTNMSIQIDGKMTYAGDGSSDRFVQWGTQGGEEIRLVLEYGGAQTGSPTFIQRAGGVIDILSDLNAYSPNTNVPFNIASRHGSTFINGAVDGTALTADTTPVALPDLSTTDLNLGYDFMGTIAQFRMWDEDLGDTGIAEAST